MQGYCNAFLEAHFPESFGESGHFVFSLDFGEIIIDNWRFWG